MLMGVRGDKDEAVLLQNYSEGMEMVFSGNFYAAIGNRSSMN
jgi:hypothetical protein